MNNDEIWHRWEPIKSGLIDNYYIDHVDDGMDGFKVLLMQENTGQYLELYFIESVWAYRSTEIGMRSDLFYWLSKEYGDDFYDKWAFFRVEQSSYIKWISNECSSTIAGINLIHFVIKGLDSVLDIIASEYPEIRFIK